MSDFPEKHTAIDKRIVLFDGTDLSQWYSITNSEDVDTELFTVRNGLIHVYEEAEANSEQPFGALITNSEFSNYDLHLSYKWGDKKFKPREEAVRDAGVIIHVYGEDVIWPSGVECQIQEGDTGDLWAIGAQVTTTLDQSANNFNPNGVETNNYGSDRKYYKFQRSYYREVQGWNKIVMKVRSENVTFHVNGHLVNQALRMKYMDDEGNLQPLTKGKILIQAEGAELFYKDIYLIEK